MMYPRVMATQETLSFISFLKDKHGELIFHQSGGCCDGSSPMCYPKDELWLNETDVLLGDIGGVPFYMNKDQFDYWKHTHLTIDIVNGRGSGFSLEAPHNKRFVVISRLFYDYEIGHLYPLKNGNGVEIQL